VEEWVRRTDWIDYLAGDPATRSTTSVCLKIVDPRVAAMSEDARQALVRRMKALVEDEGAAFDIESHRNAPAGLRIWCGCTVETADIEALTPWLDWAFETALAELPQRVDGEFRRDIGGRLDTARPPGPNNP